jgi:hypothetical protein
MNTSTPPPPPPTKQLKLDVRWIEITPAQASLWLQNNPSNRPLRESTVLAYAADMKDGNWVPTHQGICIDENGILIDGQHRLAAIVRSGCTVGMLVTRGLPAALEGKRIKTIDAVDRGASRSIKDLLKLQHGMSNNPYLIAACAAVIAVLCAHPKKQRRITMNQTLAILELYKTDLTWLANHEPTQQKFLRKATILGAIVFARSVDRDNTDRFYNALLTGANLTTDNAALTLRNWLLESKQVTEFGHGNNDDRKNISFRVLGALYYYINKKPLPSMRALQGVDGGIWMEFIKPQQDRAKKVKALLGY